MDVANYLLKYGLGGVIVAVIVVIVTGLLKSPLKKVAVAKAEEKGVDKEVFTRWLALIPLFLAFVGAVVNVSACNGWANPFLEGFDWKTTAVEAAAAWGVAVAFYENGSLFLKSLKGGKTSTSSSGSANTAKSSVAGTSKSVAKAKAKVESLSSQLAKAQETLINEEAEEKRKADAVAKAKAEAEAAAQKAAAEAEAARLKAEQEAKAKEIAAKKAQLESLEKQREGLLKEINGSNTETIN